MKVSKQSYTAFMANVDRLVTDDMVAKHTKKIMEHFNGANHEPTIKDPAKRVRWDIYWLVFRNIPREDEEFFGIETMTYDDGINDQHRDTALRQMMKDKEW